MLNLRMPYEPNPGSDAPKSQRLAFEAAREVRHTVIRVIAAHLQKDAATSRQGLGLDFTDVVFDGGNFSGAQFSGGTVTFSGAQFSGGTINFSAEFSGALIDFSWAKFSGSTVYFNGAYFRVAAVDLSAAEFSGGMVDFTNTHYRSSPPVFPWRMRRPPASSSRRGRVLSAV